MALQQYFSLLKRWLWLIVLAACIAAGISYFVTSRQPKLYQASTKLLVGQSIQNPNPNSGALVTSAQLALTYIQIAKTMPVLQRTVNALGLDMAAADLDKYTSANAIQGTQIIEVSVVDTDPARAQALANELAHQLTLEGPAKAASEQAQRTDFSQQQADDLQKKIQASQAKIAEMERDIEATDSAVEIADKQQQITVLQNQLTQWQQTYAALLTAIAPQSPNYLAILEPAGLPLYPIAPNIPQSVLVAAAIGLLLSLGGIVLIEFLDDRFKSTEEVPQLLHLPTLGSITAVQRSSDKLVSSLPARSVISESYRILRTNIQYSGVDRAIKSILVTSPGSNEGKSVTAANLAVVMAQAGMRVILIDGDLYKPSLHRLFRMGNDTGLTDGLLANRSLESLARPTTVENLRLIPTGPLPPNPTEMLGSERMRTFLQDLRADTDMIIFDTPPCLPLADAAVLSRLVDGAILVIDMPHVRRQSAIRAKESLEKIGGHIFGVVLNRVNRSELGYHYQYASADQRGKSKPAVSPGANPKILWRRLRALVRL